MSADPLAVLDQLDEARAKATPGPWAQQNGEPAIVYGDPGVGTFVAHTGVGDQAPIDAALIVAAVNALPALTAAVRAALALADEWSGAVDEAECPEPRFRYAAERIRSTVTAELGGAA